MHLGDLQAFALHPGGRMLATGDAEPNFDADHGGRVVLWSLPALEPLAEIHLEGVTGIGWGFCPRCVEFSPSGRVLSVVYNTNALAFLELPSLTKVGTNTMSGNDGPPGSLLLNDDSYLYDYDETYVISTRRHASDLTSDMRQLLGADTRNQLVGRGPRAAVAVLSPESYNFYERTRDHYSLALIDLERGAIDARSSPQLEVDNSYPEEGFALDPTGAKLAYFTRRLLQVCDTRTGAMIQRLPLRWSFFGFRLAPVWSPDSRRLVYFHRRDEITRAVCVEGNTETDVATCKDQRDLADGSSWAWQPDGDGAAFLDESDRVVCLDARLQRVLWRSDAYQDAEAIAWTADTVILLGKRSIRTLDSNGGALRNEARW
jgi:hypothetical protein